MLVDMNTVWFEAVLHGVHTALHTTEVLERFRTLIALPIAILRTGFRLAADRAARQFRECCAEYLQNSADLRTVYVCGVIFQDRLLVSFKLKVHLLTET